MSKKLFLICPFSCVEPYLRKVYGELIYCMTLPGVNIAGEAEEQLEAIDYLIRQEKITDVFVVSDLDCPFIKNIVENKPSGTWPFETIMQDIYISRYPTDFKDKNRLFRKIKLSEIYVSFQASKLADLLYQQKYHTADQLKIKAVMSCRSQNLLKEFTIRHYNYEC